MRAQVGTLRFCGSTEFSGGLWAGVELDRPEGKNDGSVAGVQYFTCRMKHGRSGTRLFKENQTQPPAARIHSRWRLTSGLEWLHSEYFTEIDP